jgi:hypothetical protein
MKRSGYLILATATVLVGGLAAPGASAHGASAHDHAHPPGAPDRAAVVAVDDALMTDLALIAAARGWTIDQAVAYHTTAERFGNLQEQVATTRPDVYAGARLGKTPGGTPTLYLKGSADAQVRSLVGAAGFPVTVVENRPWSWSELEARSEDVHRRLVDLGFRDVVTAFDEPTSVVKATAARIPTLPGRAEEVVALLPTDLRSGLRLSLTDGRVGIDFHAYGGMWVRDDGVNECTSGWSVSNGVTTGVTTAGHCDGINQISEPGVGVHTLTHQGEHRGVWGDVEWKTSTHIEPDDFYASSIEVRDVTAVEPRANITIDEYICVYGRGSNVRDCSESVLHTSVSCTINGVSNSRLVAMDANYTAGPGDSGGGWSMNTKAYGSVKGACDTEDDGVLRDLFSVADLYDEAIGVTVLTA